MVNGIIGINGFGVVVPSGIENGLGATAAAAQAQSAAGGPHFAVGGDAGKLLVTGDGQQARRAANMAGKHF